MPDSKPVQFTDVMPLECHERVIRGFIEEHMLDECGLLYSHMSAEHLRPWTHEELMEWDTLPIYNKERGDPAGQLAYEDTLMATGEYAFSQLCRYEVTGDPIALTTAAHQVYAILRVLYEGELYEPGFLPKPHGGMRQAAYSHEISPDQYIKAYIALRAYQPFGPPSLQRIIDRYLVAIADYFLNRNFQHPYRERTLVNPDTRSHCITIFIPSLWVAYKLTGAERYREAIATFDPTVDRLLGGDFELNFNLCSLFCEGFHLALSEGYEDDRLRQLIGIQWEANMTLVSGDGHGIQGPNTPVRTSRVLRMAALAPIVDYYFPQMNVLPTGLKVLGAQTEPRRMRYYLDYDPRHVPAGHRYLAESICETSVSSWLAAYWRYRRVLQADGRVGP